MTGRWNNNGGDETLGKAHIRSFSEAREALLRVGTPLVIALAWIRMVLAAYGKNPLATYWDVLHGSLRQCSRFHRSARYYDPADVLRALGCDPRAYRHGERRWRGTADTSAAIFAAYAPR